jgi:hypothetical protein
MSDDATTTDPTDTSDVGERRRAIQAERERRAQRDRQDEPPPPAATSLVRPYARMASAAGEDPDAGPEEVAGVDQDVDERVDEPVVEPAGSQDVELPAGAPDVPVAQEPGTSPASWPEPVERLRAASAALWRPGSGPGASAAAAATPPAPEQPSEPEPPTPEPSAPEPPAGWSLFTPVVPPEPLAYDDVEPYSSKYPSPFGSRDPSEPSSGPPSLGQPSLGRPSSVEPAADGPSPEVRAAPEPSTRAGADEWAELSLRVGDDDAWLRGLRESGVAPGAAADDLGPDPDELSEPEPAAPPPWIAGAGARKDDASEVEAVETEPGETEPDEAVETEPDRAVETGAVETGAVDTEDIETGDIETEAIGDEVVEVEVVQDEAVDQAIQDGTRDDEEVYRDDGPVGDAPREEVVPDEAAPEADDRPLVGAQPPFRRPPAERLTRALTDDLAAAPAGRTVDEEDEAREGNEPVRGTLEPVLRRSTERARVTPVVRPPALPPEPDDDAPGDVRAVPVSWDQAMAVNVVPGGRRGRVARARHESGGAEEYRPRPGADRSLTLLVLGMLLVLAVLIGVAVWAFWPRAVGARSLSPVASTQQAPARPA